MTELMTDSEKLKLAALFSDSDPTTKAKNAIDDLCGMVSSIEITLTEIEKDPELIARDYDGERPYKHLTADQAFELYCRCRQARDLIYDVCDVLEGRELLE